MLLFIWILGTNTPSAYETEAQQILGFAGNQEEYLAARKDLAGPLAELFRYGITDRLFDEKDQFLKADINLEKAAYWIIEGAKNGDEESLKLVAKIKSAASTTDLLFQPDTWGNLKNLLENGQIKNSSIEHFSPEAKSDSSSSSSVGEHSRTSTPEIPETKIANRY